MTAGKFEAGRSLHDLHFDDNFVRNITEGKRKQFSESIWESPNPGKRRGVLDRSKKEFDLSQNPPQCRGGGGLP
jgi:hypothetical protein